MESFSAPNLLCRVYFRRDIAPIPPIITYAYNYVPFTWYRTNQHASITNYTYCMIFLTCIESICQSNNEKIKPISDNICVHQQVDFHNSQVHPMKFMTTRCSTMLAKIKSANALSGLILNWLRFLGLLWMRKQTI